MNEKATIEVDGEVYELTHAAIRDNTQTYTGSRGERYTMRIGPEWLAVQLSAEGWDFPKRFSDDPFPCRVHVPGRDPVTGNARVMGFGAGLVSLHIHDLKPIPATPSLDEPTDPADLDWGTIRSSCARRDWRAAWGVVGTDHTGDATPGEVYLLSVARHKSATAAALHHWRKAEMESGTIFIGTDAAQAWQRIKGIAAWESSARAQAQDAADYRERMRIRHSFSGMTVTVDGRELKGMSDDSFTPSGDASDLLDSLRRIATHGAQHRPDTLRMTEETYNALMDRARAERTLSPGHSVQDEESDPELYGNGRGVQGVLNNPFVPAVRMRSTGIAVAEQPFSVMPAAMYEGLAVASRHGSERRAVTPAPAKPKARKKEKRSARHTQRRK